MAENNELNLDKLIEENKQLEAEITKLEEEIALVKERNACKLNILKTIEHE